MTDEERQKLVYRLRQTAIVRDTVGSEAAEAADEIEWLAKLLRESRQYVSDAGSDEDSETQVNSSGLLAEIDKVLR